MPAHRKAPERRQRTSTADLTPSPVRSVTAPAPLPTWSTEVAESWSEMWASGLAAHFKATDVPALERLFTLRSRLGAALEEADKQPVVPGSTGQPTLSPWFAEAHRLEAEVERLEDRFGLTPQARLRLGVTLEEGLSLAARNRELLEAFNARNT